MTKQHVSAVFQPLQAQMQNDTVVLTNRGGLAVIMGRDVLESRLGADHSVIAALDKEGQCWLNTGPVRAKALGLSDLAASIEEAYEAYE